MADNQPQQVPGMAPCQCKNIHHWRNNTPCVNPARWCQWCKDGGCTLRRQADARRVLRETRAILLEDREAQGQGGGGGGPPMMRFHFPIMPGPFGPHMLTTPWDDDDDDDDEGPD